MLFKRMKGLKGLERLRSQRVGLKTREDAGVIRWGEDACRFCNRHHADNHPARKHYQNHSFKNIFYEHDT